VEGSFVVVGRDRQMADTECEASFCRAFAWLSSWSEMGSRSDEHRDLFKAHE
jgi:hypothetical protein